MDNGDWIAGGAVRLPLQRSRRGGCCSCALPWDTFKARSRYGLDSDEMAELAEMAGSEVLVSQESRSGSTARSDFEVRASGGEQSAPQIHKTLGFGDGALGRALRSLYVVNEHTACDLD